MFAVMLKSYPVGVIVMPRGLTLSSFPPSLTSTTRASSEALRGIYATAETEVSSCFRIFVQTVSHAFISVVFEASNLKTEASLDSMYAMCLWVRTHQNICPHWPFFRSCWSCGGAFMY